MIVGLMLLRDRNSDMEASVDIAIQIFKNRQKSDPDCIHLFPGDYDLLPEGAEKQMKVKLVSDKSILKGNLWIGQEDE